MEWVSPTNAWLQHVGEISSATVMAAKRSPGVSPELNLVEFLTCMPLPSTNKAAHSGIETQRRRHEKFKTRASMAPQKWLQWRIKNYPQVAAWTLQEDVNFAKFSQKIAWNWKNLEARGRAIVPHAPLRSANGLISFKKITTFQFMICIKIKR